MSSRYNIGCRSSISQYRTIPKWETACLVIFGAALHCYGVSLVSMSHEKVMPPPDMGSLLFCVPALMLTSKLRPFWPEQARLPTRSFLFLIEIVLVIYAADVLLWTGWGTIVRGLDSIALHLDKYSGDPEAENHGLLEVCVSYIAEWFRRDCFISARTFFASIFLVIICVYNGIRAYFRRLCRSERSYSAFVIPSEIDFDEDPFGYYGPDEPEDEVDMSQATILTDRDLPHVPQEDLLYIGHRVGVRNHVQPPKKNRQRQRRR